MTRQFWLYMVEGDLPALLSAVEEASPGLVALPGKYVRGTSAEKLLAGDLSGAEFPRLSTRESHQVLLHRQASRSLVLHPILEGPLEGAQSIDLSLSDCLVLTRPEILRGRLEPAKLTGETHVMRAEKKLRKSPTFGTWLSAVHRRLKQSYPVTAVDYIHLAPAARAWVESGEGMLTYLYQPVGLDPAARKTRLTTPQKR